VENVCVIRAEFIQDITHRIMSEWPMFVEDVPKTLWLTFFWDMVYMYICGVSE